MKKLLWIVALFLPIVVLGQQVRLAWDASPDTGVTYRIYRSENPAVFPPAALASVGVNTLTYTDATVEPGKTYSYAVSSVSTTAVESQQRSNVVTVAIPIAVVVQVPSTLKGVFRGPTADKTNGLGLTGNGTLDWQINAIGLRGAPARVVITASGGRAWETPLNAAGDWNVAAAYSGSSADFWVEPAGAVDGFHLKLFYSDGSTDEVDVAGTIVADPCAANPLVVTGLKWPAAATGSRSLSWNSGTFKIASIAFTLPGTAVFTDDRGCILTVKK
jgi:hypothetical protein